MTNIFQDFHDMEFPTNGGLVYVFHYLKDGEIKTASAPFYVGQTSKHFGRFGDYVSAQFTAQTDFKVGEAIRYLRVLGFRVIVKYKESVDPRADEKWMLNILSSPYQLLNNLPGYNYKKADKEEERIKIHRFMDKIVAISSRKAQ